MNRIRIALIGGGPSALTIVRKLLCSQPQNFALDIFERNASLGKGMPYSAQGASLEHITNVSSDELCPFNETLEAWLRKQSYKMLANYGIDKTTLHAKHVVPRLLFGLYLEQQFSALLDECAEKGLTTHVHLNSEVLDITSAKNGHSSDVQLAQKSVKGFDKVIICTGHVWPKQQEGKVAGYYDSPYPPAKLSRKYNHPVALKGSSLTAIDAIRSLSTANGQFYDNQGQVSYKLNNDVPNFKIVMHSLNGLLPNIRFHLDDPLVSDDGMLTQQQITQHMAENDGFLSLDFMFEHNFKSVLQEKDPLFYKKIANKNLESFAQWMLESRKAFDPFTLFKIEYLQAEQSIKNEETLQWKEVLALLSFTLNHPAKYLSAEDMTRLHTVLLPLIGLMIANVPQSSAEQLLALHHCGVLEVISVDRASYLQIQGDNQFDYHYQDESHQPITQRYATFVDCTGQQHLENNAFPFKSMFSDEPILPAKVRFKDKQQGEKELAKGNKNVNLGSDEHYYLTLKGLAINDDFQPILANGSPSNRYFVMAVPFISGFNPDYSGFDFCDQVSRIIVDKLCEEVP